jgi:hypothetical protein
MMLRSFVVLSVFLLWVFRSEWEPFLIFREFSSTWVRYLKLKNIQETYFIEFFDEASGESSEDCTGKQLQDEAVEPHVDRKQRLVDDLTIIFTPHNCNHICITFSMNSVAHDPSSFSL